MIRNAGIAEGLGGSGDTDDSAGVLGREGWVEGEVL
jgi:hypothetical protein